MSAGSFLYARRGRDPLLEGGATRQPDGKSSKTGFKESTWVMQRSRTEHTELCAQTHRRASDAAYIGQRCLLLSAALAGCSLCVRRHVEEGGAGHFTTALGAICHLAVRCVTLDTMRDMAQSSISLHVLSLATRVRGLSYMLVDHGPTTQPGSASCQDKCCRTTGAVSFLKSGSPAVLVAAIAVAFAVAPTAMCAVAAATDLD